jgi:2-polyprenyl-3-methyl-5-hydroxy-6-metoxy-1,4-benzoquinol methylase
MAQNVYDRPDFFEGYSRLRRSIQGLDGAPEWPTLRAMLPNLTGKRVVDLGCGYGWFSRWAAAGGAHSVLGIDVSEKMLAQAHMHETPDPIAYRRGDLEALVLPEQAFDIAFSSLAFHYVADASRLYRMIAQALVPGGRLVFSTEHPVLMASIHSGWMQTANGRRVWPVSDYFREGERVTDWLSAGVVKYHRTLGTTFSALVDAGFRVEQLVEFSPSKAQIDADPGLAEEVERPMFVLVSAALSRSGR